MINSNDLISCVIRPTLVNLTAYSKHMKSEAAENLLLWTAIMESEYKGETRLKQLNYGPAISPWQIEPETHDDMWHTFINGRTSLSYILRDMAGKRHNNSVMVSFDELYHNLMYACAIARIKYWRVPKPLPDAFDFEGMFEYWFKFYNANPQYEEIKHERFITLAKESIS